MSESISQRINAADLSAGQERALAAILNSIVTDLQAVAASVNQLITDYNANATIDTDTTAAAITLVTTK